MQEALMRYTQKHTDISLSARAYIVYHGSRPMCKVCNGNTYYREWRFGETCSLKCAANNERRNLQIKETILQKYGVDNISKSGYFYEKMKAHNLEKYGVEHYMQSSEFKNKSQKSCIEKYGTKHYSQTEKFQKGMKEHNFEKYGVEHYSQTSEFKEKIKKTCIKRYGVEHHMQSLEVFEKQQRNSYYFKDYILPSGKIARVQGYEPRALDELLLTYKEEDLLISNHDIFMRFGAFVYFMNGKKHRYYPDIYLIPENRFIEVKSSRTFSVNKEKNLIKRDCILGRGCNFSFWIYGKTGKRVID